MDVDVAVIGAGPSGALAACLLARGGARVRLLDGSHPREKPCGGGVTGRALALLNDSIAVGEIAAVHIQTARFVDSAGRPPAAASDVTSARKNRTAVVPLSRNGLVVASRRIFDGRLLDAARQAGAEHVVSRVRRLTGASGRFRIETADGHVHTAAQIVGADGANSLTRRSLAHAFHRGQLSTATGYFAHGVSSTEVIIEVMSDPPGYYWSFPRPDHLAIGVCTQADIGVDVGTLRSMCADWIRRLDLAPATTLEAYSWPIPSLSASDFRNLPVGGTGWYLTGDAAGLVDPITREGIFFALQSAQFAADAILHGGSTETYTTRVRREITADLARAARLKSAFFQAGFPTLLLGALARSSRIRSVMADLIAGTQSYEGLKWRLARTLEVGLAWQLLQR